MRDLVPTTVIAEDFDRIARFAPSDTEVSSILARLPTQIGTALDVGCGTGGLARQLARRTGRVVAIDVSPGMVWVARERSRGIANLEIHVADVMTWPIAEGAYDVVGSIDTLHHLPFEPALARLASAVAHGGTLLVVDLFDASALVELPYNAVSVAWRFVQRRRTKSTPRAPGLARAWQTHDAHDRLLPLGELRRRALRVLPAVRVRRHLGWRYSMEWRRP